MKVAEGRVDDTRRPVRLTAEEEADVVAGIREIEAGQRILVSRLHAKVRKHLGRK